MAIGALEELDYSLVTLTSQTELGSLSNESSRAELAC
jgi:hypothetical protein